jgi:hypothetical protein
MWQMDRPNKAYRHWAFLSEFPDRLGKTTTTMLELTQPIHGKGKVIVGDSGFCVREGVIECYKHGIWFQANVKKHGNWPQGEPGEVINSYFDDLPLGHCKTHVSEHNTLSFVFTDVAIRNLSQKSCQHTHPMYQKVDDQWESFKYMEPFSCYSKAKHWVDNVNNRRHNPSLPQPNFCRKLAQQMMENTIDMPVIPDVPPMHVRRPRNVKHILKKRKREEGVWNPTHRCFNDVTSEYVRLRCH